MSDRKSTFDFGAIEPITGAIGLAYNIGSGIADQVINSKNDKWNKEFANKQFAHQQDIFNYQKDLNRQIMEREDNAVQRRAKDLEAAGLSKTLAAGDSAQASVMNSAGASGLGSIGASNRQSRQLHNMNIANGYADFHMKNANRDMFKEQVNTEKSLQNMYNEQANLFKEEALSQKDYRDNLVSQTALNNAREKYHLTENEFLKWDYALSVLQDMRSNDQKHSIYNSVKSFSFEVNNRLAGFLKGLGVPKLEDFMEFLKSLSSSSPTQ